MKHPINTIPQIYRNVRRWTEIISVLSKYGLADWISRLNIEFAKDHFRTPDGEALARQSHETRLRLAMTVLGPTFIKLGQLLSTRPDVIGMALATELTKLQADVPADPFAEVKETVEEQLGRPLEQMFSEFSEEPIASASIGQAHRATLRNGSQVIVKVQHSGIAKVIENDLDILAGVAQLADKIDDFKPFRPKLLVEEMSRTMLRELDFGREHANLLQFHGRYATDPKVSIPKPFSEFCSSKVLTMEYIAGTKLSLLEDLKRQGVDLPATARVGADTYLRMIFEEGFFHADPHPGNLLVKADGSLAILDFGMVGRISESLREDIEEMLLAIVNNDVPMLTSIIRRVGAAPTKLDEKALARDIADIVGQYSTQSLSHFQLSSALNDMTQMIRNHRILLPGEAALLIKVLMTLEGTARTIWPDISLMEIMVPVHRKLVLRRLSPARQYRKVRRITAQLEHLGEHVPQRISSILEQMQTGKFDVHLDHRRLGPSVNRLVLGLLTSALFVGSALMLSFKVSPLLFPGKALLGMQDLSLFGLFGVMISSLMGFRLAWAIRKSGNLDEKENED
jgi:ubiquinone biosynthesis protein